MTHTDIGGLMLQTSLMLAGIAWMTVRADKQGFVHLLAHSADECAPGVLQVNGDPDLLECARYYTTVQLEVVGIKFRARVITRLKGEGELLISAQPLFRELDQHIRALGRRQT